MKDVIGRSKELAQVAQENGVRLMIDAEQTYFQPAIHYIAVNVLMPKYNLTTPTIYNTIQSYLKVSSDWLKATVAAPEDGGVGEGEQISCGWRVATISLMRLHQFNDTSYSVLSNMKVASPRARTILTRREGRLARLTLRVYSNSIYFYDIITSYYIATWYSSITSSQFVSGNLM